jgi:nicotinamidase-related amidase
MTTGKRALIVIDPQNDYFPGGKFPLWNSEETLAGIERAIAAASAQGLPVIIVQHVAKGPAPFFTAGSVGAELHPRIKAAAPTAPVVVKQFADAFVDTRLDAILHETGIDQLLIGGMMTQNCVTHTAISKTAEAYKVTVLPNCCTTVSEILHAIALNALSTRVALVPSGEALGGPAG